MARTAHAAASGVRCTVHAAGVERAVYVASSCRIDACCIGASARVASVRVACCVGVCCMLHRRVLHVASCKRAAVPQRTVVQSVVRCLVRVRCPIGRRAGCCGCRAAARCACVQSYGGVLSMFKGTALFDAVAISGTRATVRAGLVRRCAVGAGVGGRGASADCNRRGCAGLCAVGRRRRGEHTGWGRHVQGRLDLEQHGGACAQRESRVPRAVVWYVARCGTADRWRARRMLRRVLYGVRRMRPAWSVLCMLHHHCRIDACCIGASARVASVRVACCVGACCMLHRRVLHVACSTLHVANAQPSRSARSCSPLCGGWCACAARLGEGRAVAVAERRRVALVRRPAMTAACSP
jgi:hypothetical protein